MEYRLLNFLIWDNPLLMICKKSEKQFFFHNIQVQEELRALYIVGKI